MENIRYREAVPELIRNEGFGSLYKGFGALLLRDMPGWGVYFWCYEFLKKAFNLQEAKKNGTEYSWLNIAIKVWCAGVAGQASWAIGYPQDIIKTHI